MFRRRYYLIREIKYKDLNTFSLTTAGSHDQLLINNINSESVKS